MTLGPDNGAHLRKEASIGSAGPRTPLLAKSLLSVEEAAEVLGVSSKTIKRDWSVAKAWLYADLKERHGIDAAAMGERQSAV